MANLLNPLLAGQALTATFFNNSIDNARSVTYQKTDLTQNNTTTYVDSTNLVLPVLANAAYTFESCMFYDTSAAAAVRIRITLPAGAAALIAPWSSNTSASANAINQQGAAPASNVIEWQAGGVASGTVMSIRPVGWINIAGAAGNLVIGFAQLTATAVNTLLKTGSWFAVTRVF